MAYIFSDPTTGYTTIADMNLQGWQVTGAGNPEPYSPTKGRFGLGGFRMYPNMVLQRNFVAVANTTSVFLQFARKWAAGVHAEGVMLNFLNNGGVDNCLTVWRTANDAIQVRDAFGTVKGTSAPNVLSANTWHVICVRALIGSLANGTYDVYVDDMVNPLLTLTGVDTSDGATTGCDAIQLSEFQSNQDSEVSDIFCWSSDGTAPNGLIGDVRHYPLLPTSDTINVAWTENGGAPAGRFEKVNDPLNLTFDTATYNSTSAAGVLDEFGFADLPAGVINIVGVMSILTAKKTNSGTEPGPLEHRIKSGGAAAVTVAVGPLTTDYVNYQAFWGEDPNTAATWVEAGVNALLAGYRIP